MPTIFTHGFIAINAYYCLRRQPLMVLLLVAVLCSMAPDADVAAFYFGIPYEHVLGHRGITHSISFAVLLAAFAAYALKIYSGHHYTFLQLFILLFVATILHPLTDALTNGGLGVALFAPFFNDRYFFLWRPVQVSPIGADHFFSKRGWEVLKSELFFLWIPALLATLFVLAIRIFITPPSVK